MTSVLQPLECGRRALYAGSLQQAAGPLLMLQAPTFVAAVAKTLGLADFLNVLDAQRSLYASEDQLVQSEQTVAANLIALYKAMGGGWEIAPEAPH